MIIASGTSGRMVSAMAQHLVTKLKAGGYAPKTEGEKHGDWVLVDSGDVIVHLFRPEVRSFYNIEKIWAAPAAPDPTAVKTGLKTGVKAAAKPKPKTAAKSKAPGKSAPRKAARRA
jgi:ribosome-associated protein